MHSMRKETAYTRWRAMHQDCRLCLLHMPDMLGQVFLMDHEGEDLPQGE
jgi:hypothetical protein